MRRSPRDILASLYCDVDNYRFLRRRANQSVAVLAESDICKASYTASQKAESLQRGHITSMLSKFEVPYTVWRVGFLGHISARSSRTLLVSSRDDQF